jgi:hypothetical protein
MTLAFVPLLLVSATLFQGEEHAPLRWYIALRAADKFHATHGRFPGESEEQVVYANGECVYCCYDDAAACVQMEADTDALGSLAAEICASLGLDGPPVTCKHVAELCVF